MKWLIKNTLITTIHNMLERILKQIMWLQEHVLNSYAEAEQ